MTEVTTQADQAKASEEQASEAGGMPSSAPTYTDGFSYEVPRPFLSLPQAASVLGMTIRAVERRVTGRWGNKLPEGWLARKMKTSQGDEWRILPPPGFRVKLNVAGDYAADEEGGEMMDQDQPISNSATAAANAKYNQSQSALHGMQSAAGDPLSFYATTKRKLPWNPERHTLEQPTIIIDRTEEVENLLRELVATKGALAEERRVHMEDMRMIAQMQGSMRLLEVNAGEHAKVKTELESAKQELGAFKAKYNQLINAPWWRKLFGQ